MMLSFHSSMRDASVKLLPKATQSRAWHKTEVKEKRNLTGSLLPESKRKREAQAQTVHAKKMMVLNQEAELQEKGDAGELASMQGMCILIPVAGDEEVRGQRVPHLLARQLANFLASTAVA